jgi:hypothetical protein
VNADHVIFAAEECERWLRVEDMAFLAGDFEVAADCADRAELFSRVAFQLVQS